jgi:hypothetical protein
MPNVPIPYALEPVSVSGTLLTLDQYVNSPTVITRRIAEIAGQRFYADKIFSAGPPVEGGALLYERPNPLLTDLYASRRTQEIAQGTQFPVLDFARGVPQVAVPRKIGGKIRVFKEERRRNRADLLQNNMVQAGNTLARDIEIMALSEINTVITATSRTTPAAAAWSTYNANTYNNTTRAAQPLSDILTLTTGIDLEERGHHLNAALFHPTDYAALVRYYGASGVRPALEAVGIMDWWTTPRIAAGSVGGGGPLFFEKGQVGVWSN